MDEIDSGSDAAEHWDLTALDLTRLGVVIPPVPVWSDDKPVGGAAVLRRDRINVLYLAAWFSQGESDKGPVDWFRYLGGDRFRRYLVTTQSSDDSPPPLIGDHVGETWNLPDLLPGAAMPAFILDFIRARQVHLVHVMNSRLGFDLLPAIKRANPHLRVVIQLNGEEEDRFGYCRYVCTRYDNLIDRYSSTRSNLGTALGDYGVSPSKLTVIHAGVDHAAARGSLYEELVGGRLDEAPTRRVPGPA